MKKITTLVAAVALAATLTACGNSANAECVEKMKTAVSEYGDTDSAMFQQYLKDSEADFADQCEQNDNDYIRALQEEF